VNGAPPGSGGLRIGVVGVGHLGTYHAEKYLSHPAVAALTLFDTEAGKAEQRAAEIETSIPVSVAETLEECLAACDAVTVAVPTSAHREVAGQALAGGCHVLIEKPIADDSRAAGDLVDAAATGGRILQVGHVERFNPAFQGLDVGELAPGFIEAHRLAPWNPRGTDVGVVFDLMVHDLDLILHLVGERPGSVAAVGVPVISSTPDIANARITFPGGCVANITASRVSLAPMRKLRVFQSAGYLSFDLQAGKREFVRLRGSGEVPGEGEDALMRIGDRAVTRTEEGGDQDALALEVDAFLRAVSAASGKGASEGAGAGVGAGSDEGALAGAYLPPHGVSGREATAALELAEEITGQIGGN